MSQASSFDDSIPVLTEILHAADSADVNAELNLALEAEAEAEAEAPAEPRLEQAPSEHILLQLQQRITIALEQRMADVLHHALLGLSQEIRAGLHISIEQIVAQELAQLKAEIGKAP